jgi:hypothetical protein
MSPQATYSTVLRSLTLPKRKESVCEEPNGRYKRRGSGRDDQGGCKGKVVRGGQTNSTSQIRHGTSSWVQTLCASAQIVRSFVHVGQAELALTLHHMPLLFTAVSFLECFHGKQP